MFDHADRFDFPDVEYAILYINIKMGRTRSHDYGYRRFPDMLIVSQSEIYYNLARGK